MEQHTDKYKLHHGDCREVMAQIAEASVDAVVTDPPYGLSFMGKDWDHGIPGEAFWREALRVAKPGAHLLAFGGTRTYHRLTCAIEDAGWEIRDCIMWVYSSGFPKSHDVSKAIDKAAGAEQEVVGSKRLTGNACVPAKDKGGTYGVGVGVVPPQDVPITAPATDAAKRWQGWGTALKPAYESIIMARKPLSSTVAANVQEYGTGAININGCRVPTSELTPRNNRIGTNGWKNSSGGYIEPSPLGRWPANVIHDGSVDVLEVFPVTSKSSSKADHSESQSIPRVNFVQGSRLRKRSGGYDEPSGSAARFFYCAKVTTHDRDEGCEASALQTRIFNGQSDHAAGLAPGSVEAKFSTRAHNNHPTVKPTDLMRYLCRLVTPPNGVVLDPFMGSGSTGKAAILEGYEFIGIEQSLEYIEIARQRIAWAEARQSEKLFPY